MEEVLTRAKLKQSLTRVFIRACTGPGPGPGLPQHCTFFISPFDFTADFDFESCIQCVM